MTEKLCGVVHEITREACDAPEGHSFPRVHETDGRAWSQYNPSAPDTWCPVCGASPGSRCRLFPQSAMRGPTLVDFPHRGRPAS